jgi:nifR3 family TIM-barrel protein
MSGRTDVAFRLGVREIGGIGLAFTDLTNPVGILRRNLRTSQILSTCEEDRPLGIQIYGAKPELMAEAAACVEGEFRPAVVDINMGCPARKVTRRGAGSALMATPDLAVRIVESVRRAVSVPVTVKLRLGVEASSLTAPELAPGLVAAGAAALTVHGRTARQRYSGAVSLAGIRRVVEAVEGVPVFANGNVTDFASAGRMLRETGAAGLAIGRAAMRNPWIFKSILARDRGVEPPLPGRAERVEFMRTHFRRLVEVRGVLRGCRQFRKWVSQYGRVLEMTRSQRAEFLRLSAPERLEDLAEELLRTGGQSG